MRNDLISKRLSYLIVGLLCLFLLPITGSIGSAQHAGVQIKNVSVQLIETRPPIGTRVIHVYNIIAVLYNNDTTTSDDITVNFFDPEYNSSTTPPMKLSPLNATLNPDETKTFILADWPTPLSGKIPLNISFSPSSPKVLPNEKNSGYYVYILDIPTTKKTASTPGFEILIVLGAIAVFLLSRPMKK